jgi:hypothetical protein
VDYHVQPAALLLPYKTSYWDEFGKGRLTIIRKKTLCQSVGVQVLAFCRGPVIFIILVVVALFFFGGKIFDRGAAVRLT